MAPTGSPYPADQRTPYEMWPPFLRDVYSVAVPVYGIAGALIGLVLGMMVGSAILGQGVIESGTSSGMPAAVVGAVGGGVGWLLGSLSRMIARRNDPPSDGAQTRALVVVAVGLVGVGFLLSDLMPMLEDTFKDPRMFRLQRLIALDAALAALTCLILVPRRWPRRVILVLVLGTGLAFLVVAGSQFLPFLAECAPVPSGGCRSGF